MTPSTTGTGARLVAVFAAGVVLGAVSAVSIVPSPSAVTTYAAPAPGTDTSLTGVPGATASAGPDSTRTTTTTTTNQGGNTLLPGAVPPARAGLECAPGRNGGSTDKGVSATEIKLATTVVASGIGSSFLGEMRYAMSAVVSEVNQAGGICGRRLAVEYKDDGWSRQAGLQYLSNYIHAGVFAIPVGASSEGLNALIENGDLDRAGPPVVGTDGLAIRQYVRKDGTAQPWVWPVATPTASSARIMADEAYDRGARNFAIVFDKNYRFGEEAASAFNAEVRRLTGKNVDGYDPSNSCIRRFCGILAGQNSYSNEVANVFNAGPDFVAMFLEPQTALTWMGDANTPSAGSGIVKYGYGGAQPLFTQQFAAQCKAKCDQMVVWTGFKPNIEGYAADPAVRAYVSALKRTKPDADTFNQFTEGAYVGMQLFVDALRRVGPDLTRERLRAVLNATTFRSGLTIQDALPFTPSTRYANVSMQAFTVQYKGSYSWRTGTIRRDARPQAGADA